MSTMPDLDPDVGYADPLYPDAGDMGVLIDEVEQAPRLPVEYDTALAFLLKLSDAIVVGRRAGPVVTLARLKNAVLPLPALTRRDAVDLRDEAAEADRDGVIQSVVREQCAYIPTEELPAIAVSLRALVRDWWGLVETMARYRR